MYNTIIQMVPTGIPIRKAKFPTISSIFPYSVKDGSQNTRNPENPILKPQNGKLCTADFALSHTISLSIDSKTTQKKLVANSFYDFENTLVKVAMVCD